MNFQFIELLTQLKIFIFSQEGPLKGGVNPYFLELQQKNAESGQNCPYGYSNDLAEQTILYDY